MHIARARALALAAVLAGCSAEAPRPALPRAPVAATPAPAPAYASPAVWDFHPPAPMKLFAKVRTGDGKLVFAGAGGERWLFDPREGTAVASAHTAPEDLWAIGKGSGGGLVFVGASGQAYEAADPLAPLGRALPAPEPFVRVVAAGSAILGITRAGALARSGDGGATWTAPQTPAAGDRRLYDVAIAEDGRALVLAMPEQLWLSRDGGATFESAGVAPIGARRVGIDTTGDLAAEGPTSSWVWRAGAGSAIVRGAQPVGGLEIELATELATAPDAAAVAQGRAALTGEEYVEVVPPASDAPGHFLAKGHLAGRLVRTPLDAAKSCSRVALGAFGKTIEVACVTSARGGGSRVRMLRSEDSGATWKDDGGGMDLPSDLPRVAVGAGGAVLVAGVCKPTSAKNACQVGVPLRRSGTGVGFLPVALDSLKGKPDAVAFDPTGKLAYFVGRRSKDDALALFASRDAGATWSAQPLEPKMLGATDVKPEDTTELFESARALALAPGDDHTIALTLQTTRGTLLATFDEDGRTLGVASPPERTISLGAVGSRALALAPRTRLAWESLDAGATWQKVPHAPAVRCEGRGDCEAEIRCSPSGCLVGGALSRVGWRAAPEEERPAISAPQQPAATTVRATGTPLVCKIEKSPWAKLPGLGVLPDARAADKGKATWTSLTADREKASAGMLHGIGGARPHVETISLLAPMGDATGVAMRTSSQVEGGAAIRYRFTVPKQGDPIAVGPMRNVEVGWDNAFEGKVAHATLADAGPVLPSDVRASARGVSDASVDLISVTDGGIFLRPHSPAQVAQPMYFIGYGGKVLRSDYPTWPRRGLSGEELTLHGDAVRAAGKSVPVALLSDGSLFLRAMGSPPKLDAMALAGADLDPLGVASSWDFTYVRGAPALVHFAEQRAAARASAEVLLFNADGDALGPPIFAPTQLDLADPPRACTADDRASTARLVSAFQPGTRHPVLVTGGAGEPSHTMLTAQAVLYGTKASPCVAAFDATAVSPATRTSEIALVPVGDLEHAWLFRKSPTGGPIEYRIMACKFDASAEVPAEVWAQNGVQRPAPPR